MTKPIRITDANEDRINEYIRSVEGKARERVVTYAQIVKAIDKIERTLNIPKKWLEGIEGSVDYWAQSFPRAYRYTPLSTVVYFERKGNAWYFLGCDRDPCSPPGHAVKLKLTPDAERAIIESREVFGL